MKTKGKFVCGFSLYNHLFYIWAEDGSRLHQRVCVCVSVGQEANDKVKRQTGWLRCPQLEPIGSPKIHHSCPLANPRMPCGAGISLDDCYLVKCSQANDAGSRGWCKMWSLKTEFSILGRVFLFKLTCSTMKLEIDPILLFKNCIIIILQSHIAVTSQC